MEGILLTTAPQLQKSTIMVEKSAYLISVQILLTAMLTAF